MAHRVAWSPRAIEDLERSHNTSPPTPVPMPATVVKTILNTTRSPAFDRGLRLRLRWLDELAFRYDLVNLSSTNRNLLFQQPARGHADRRTYQGNPGALEIFCPGDCEV